MSRPFRARCTQVHLRLHLASETRAEQRRQLEQKYLNNEKTVCTFQPKLMTQDYYLTQSIRNQRNLYNQEMDDENSLNNQLNEFNDDSAQKKKRPAVSIEKMVIKDGETIHLNWPHSPKLMLQN